MPPPTNWSRHWSSGRAIQAIVLARQVDTVRIARRECDIHGAEGATRHRQAIVPAAPAARAVLAEEHPASTGERQGTWPRWMGSEHDLARRDGRQPGRGGAPAGAGIDRAVHAAMRTGIDHARLCRPEHRAVDATAVGPGTGPASVGGMRAVTAEHDRHQPGRCNAKSRDEKLPHVQVSSPGAHCTPKAGLARSHRRGDSGRRGVRTKPPVTQTTTGWPRGQPVVAAGRAGQKE